MRIMIFGLPGAGKSTFARTLGALLHIPVFHLDHYFFKEKWMEREPQEFLAIQQSLVDQTQWIIEGNAIKSLEMRYARATIVIYFRYNRFLCLWRLIKRVIVPGEYALDLPPGATKNIRWRLIKYMWSFNTRVEHTVDQLRQKYPQTIFYIFSTDADAEKFLAAMTTEDASTKSFHDKR